MTKSKFSDDPKAMHFQIRFDDKNGCGTYRYFSAMTVEEARTKSELVADDEYLLPGYENANFRSFGYFKPLRSAKVVQYDRGTKEAMRGGIKFKIRLSFVQATYASGRKERAEFYKADVIEQKKKSPIKL